MRLEEWEATIQKMIDECNQEQTSLNRALMEWRVTLEKEPTLLKPFEIDQLVRTVRGRLSTATG
jgi:hypothetical protein